MGPEPVHLTGSANLEEDTEEVFKRLERIGSTIMSRARVTGGMVADPVAGVLSDRDKHRDAAILLGQAYVTAYTMIAANKDAVEEIAEVLIDRKEMYGDEVIDLLQAVDLHRPQINLLDDRTWPTV
jgi:hypothetical protein